MTNAMKTSAGAAIVIHHQVSPDYLQQYEQWLAEIIQAAGEFNGHQGVTILKPAKEQPHYDITVRFDSRAAAERWLQSSTRQQLIAKVATLLQLPEDVRITSGIDYWFQPLNSPSPHPVRWKQWLVTTLVICMLTMLVPPLLQLLFQLIPMLGLWGIRHLLNAGIVVALVIFIIMPRLVPLIAKWMFKP
jgi:uncharacterized protein